MSTPRPTFAEHEFHKASISEPHRDCVRVARRDGWVEVRDDKTAFGAPDDHRLTLTEREFDDYQSAVTAGTPGAGCLTITPTPERDLHTMRAADSPDGPTLTFTTREIAAFHHGITHGDFRPN